MKTLDRVILGVMTAGIWTAIAMFYLHPTDAIALSIDASDIDGLEYFIENIIEDCTVGGEVYLYSERYGEIESGQISC